MQLQIISNLCGIDCKDNIEILDVAPLNKATPLHITCFHNIRYIDQLKNTKAGACFVKKDYASHLPSSTIALIHDNPYACFGKVLAAFFSNALRPKQNDLRHMAFIHESVHIGKNCVIGPFCILEKGVVLGDNVTLCSSVVLKENVVIGAGGYIEDHVTIAHSAIGENVFVKTGARIGQAGFGFDMSEKGPTDIPQIGKVIIKDNVQIGANTCIDRGSLLNTIIENGVRIDNLVQIAHNVTIDQNAVVVAQCGIAGSTSIGKHSVLGGQVGVAGHLSIGDCVKIAAQSGVMKDVKDNQTIGGCPAVPVSDWHRQTIFLKNMVQSKNK